jgi:hypothetical protein
MAEPPVSLSPVPADQPGASCAHCGAALVSDQRYCLSCGQPVSPVRLAFLDVIGSERGAGTAATQQWVAADQLTIAPAGYGPAAPVAGAGGWLRRNSPLLSLLSVLVLCLIAGLLLGHWAGQGKASSGPQVVKIEGLSAAPVAAAPASTASKPASQKSTAKEEAEEAAEAAKETKQEKAPPPPPVKVSKTKIQKLTQSTGKKHQEEINSLGAQPIETG